MNPITYRQLLEALQELTEDQLDYYVSSVVLIHNTQGVTELHNFHNTIARFSLADYDDLDSMDLEDDLPLLVRYESI
jgi:hypothetical protein